MKPQHLKVIVPGIFAAAALALAVGVGAQTPPPPALSPAARSPQAAPMSGLDQKSAAAAKQAADLKAECQTMMARKQEMQDKLKAMDATLDELVAKMNATQPEVDMEKPMAAVINELVAQRKASHAMMMEMQSEMTAHMMRQMQLRDAKGTMDHPMMKLAKPPEPKAEENKPRT